MCVGVPMQIVAVEGHVANARDGDTESRIDLALTGPLPPGAWVLVSLGRAREALPEAEALKIRAALDALRAVMRGGEASGAFADLEARGPQLPPHLAAARAAGKTVA